MHITAFSRRVVHFAHVTSRELEFLFSETVSALFNPFKGLPPPGERMAVFTGEDNFLWSYSIKIGCCLLSLLIVLFSLVFHSYRVLYKEKRQLDSSYYGGGAEDDNEGQTLFCRLPLYFTSLSLSWRQCMSLTVFGCLVFSLSNLTFSSLKYGDFLSPSMTCDMVESIIYASYHFAKFCLYWTFLARIVVAYEGTTFQYSNLLIYSMMIAMFLFDV